MDTTKTSNSRSLATDDARVLSLESAILERARAGDAQAFGSLVERYQDRVFNAVFRMCGHHDEALDLTQDAFVKAFRSLDGFRGESGFYTWLFRIAVNLTISARRRRKPVVSLDDVSDDGRPRAVGADDDMRRNGEMERNRPDRAAESEEQKDAVWTALRSLGDEHRTILVLREIEGLDYEQIADMLDIPPGTVRSRLHRARAALKVRLSNRREELTP